MGEKQEKRRGGLGIFVRMAAAIVGPTETNESSCGLRGGERREGEVQCFSAAGITRVLPTSAANQQRPYIIETMHSYTLPM